MNHSQKKVAEYMDYKIGELRQGLDKLNDRDIQPNAMGNLYNGMLKSNVEYEVKHMEHLKNELIESLK